uniref:Gonadotropin-releasing hormone receptor n=1 Tax=Octopus vulgaris TaxID=6645 RepID=GNRHR_OCTVU|nr:RecName: Full=Gonadotropin-releasing hormone receptor; Short=GnRH receptor; Short=GnRH-R; Short=oct-GnRHR [Octopus vulgaris]BAE66647.1 GnRH receptor [Octopus vulgaris]BAE66648.1 GnRH receptor [Octopus vulgaris]
MDYLNDSMFNNMTYNITSTPLPDAPRFDNVYVSKLCVLGTVFVISFFGNTLVIIQIFRIRGSRSTIQSLILNLAIADLMVSFFNILMDIIWSATVEWLAGNTMCKIMKYLTVFGLHLSTYITVSIALDRCFAILSPMSRSKAPLRVRIMITMAWVLSAIFSIPQAVIFQEQRKMFRQGMFHQCRDSYNALWQKQLYSASSLILLFVIPLIIMVTSYLLILKTIVKTSRQFHDTPISPTSMSCYSVNHGQIRTHLFERARKRSSRMSAVIVAAFILCWTPYYIIFLGFAFFQWDNSRTVIYFFTLGTSNCMLNPLIYGAFTIYKVHRGRSGSANSPSGTRLMIMVNKRGRSTTTTTNRMSGSGRRQLTTGQTITQCASLTNPHQPVRPSPGINSTTSPNGKMPTKPPG